MTCSEIENRLPAYLEDTLSPEEKKNLTEHLAFCPQCSRALADLKMAEQIVHGLDEVEPPPFFEQRIMARVREEAGRKQGIFQKLFYPLHIKVPIQALATILVAVLAFHIYQTNEPEMKQAVPLPLPMTARDLHEKDRQPYATPPFKSSGAGKGIIASQAPVREERPAAAESAAPAVAKAEKETYSVGSQTLNKAEERAGKQDADQALATRPPEQKRKMMTADTGATAGESNKAVYAPSPARMAAGAAIHRSVVDLTIQVEDTADAIGKIEARLSQINARIIERGRRNGSEFLKVEIPARDVAAFLDGLKTIGRVNVETQPPAVPNENVTVNIKIVGRQ